MKNLQEYLIESLYSHICCEMNSNYKFYEKFGIPEFVEKSTKEICDCISKYVDDISSIPDHINFDIDNVIDCHDDFEGECLESTVVKIEQTYDAV